MSRTSRGRDGLAIVLLALLPLLAYAPAWWEGRLLGPGDGAALHYPLRAAVWAAYRRLEIPSWNPWIFSGTPLLAAYRPGAFFPPMPLLSPLPDFLAFQALVLFSLSASAVLLYLYLRRLGASCVGAYLSGLCFALGPYLVGHLGDTATLTAAPTLPLVLIAAEAFVRRGSPGRTLGLAAAVALVLVAGSPEAARAGGALVVGRLVVAYLFPAGGQRSAPGRAALALAAGVLLAAPQVLPTLLAAREAGRQVTGLAAAGERPLPGITGLILRYVSSTPAPSLALAALPLVLSETPIRVLGVALGLCLALQWGRGPLSAPGALALVFDLTLAVLAGLSFSAQWEVRREALGRRLRAYLLVACLASAAGLSVSAAALGPLPQTLAGAVGILALAMILYFSLAASEDRLKAGLWLLPLTVSLLLQPHGRQTWESAPTREALETTPTRESLERAMGLRRGERVLALTSAWPREQELDLAWANLGGLLGRRSANGYDPMVPLRYRAAFEGMGAGGTLPGAFFRGDPVRLEALGVRWVQVPTSALSAQPDALGLGERLDLTLEAGLARSFPLPITSATELRLASLMSEAVRVPQGQPVARILVHLASGRELELALRAGLDTAEWAYDRPDVRGSVAHERPVVLESWPGPGGAFLGHNYLGTLALPGRYFVDGLRIERLPGAGRLTIMRLAVFDAVAGRATAVSLAAGYVSDTARLREAAVTPAVRLFEVRGATGPARVVEKLRLLPDDASVLRDLRLPDLDSRREALAVAAEAGPFVVPPGARASRAEVKRALPGRLDVQAEGPGLLVVAEGWDPGWSAMVDGRPADVLRVNHIQMGVALPAGFHRIALRHHAQGLYAGCALAGLGAVGLALALRRG